MDEYFRVIFCINRNQQIHILLILSAFPRININESIPRPFRNSQSPATTPLRQWLSFPDVPPRQALNYPTRSGQNIDKQKQCHVSDDRTASFNSKE